MLTADPIRSLLQELLIAVALNWREFTHPRMHLEMSGCKFESTTGGNGGYALGIWWAEAVDEGGGHGCCSIFCKDRASLWQRLVRNYCRKWSHAFMSSFPKGSCLEGLSAWEAPFCLDILG